MEDLIDINDELYEGEAAEMIVYRNPKVYLERQNQFLIYTEEKFYTNYRMKKAVAAIIVNLIRDEIKQGINNHGLAISPEIQVLATIRYLAKGSYGVDMAEQHGLSQPVLSIISKRVVEAIAGHCQQFFCFPEGDNLQQTKYAFYNIAHCPNIVGAIDGTHIKIKCPGGEHSLTYINRKGFYSLNVQVVSDAKCIILDLVARWRGSTHDSRIWNECPLKRRFENGDIKGILLGENGYLTSRFLLTPLLNPTTDAELRYNRADISTHNVEERLFGIWKNKFRCFFNGLNLKLETTKAAIVAAAVIHNIIINNKDDNGDTSDEDEEHNEADNMENNNEEENIAGNIFRNNYIRQHFH